MTAYRVIWEIDVEADTPKEAALKARAAQEPGTLATIFKVKNTETKKSVWIDLEDIWFNTDE